MKSDAFYGALYIYERVISIVRRIGLRIHQIRWSLIS